LHDVGDFSRDVDAHLVQKHQRSDRETPLDQRPIDRVDRRAFEEQVRRFIDVRGDDPTRVEADAVVHDDHCLAHALAGGHGGGHGF
jgi:hypothetical protein